MNIVEQTSRFVTTRILSFVKPKHTKLFSFGIQAVSLTAYESLGSNARLVIENIHTANSKIYRLVRNKTQAILEGLESKTLSAAGIDVMEEECNLKEERELLTKNFLEKCDLKTQLLNHVLLQRDDVIFTSHNAFNSQEALIQILEITSKNITLFLEGKSSNVIK